MFFHCVSGWVSSFFGSQTQRADVKPSEGGNSGGSWGTLEQINLDYFNSYLYVWLDAI